jgi:hypothetical protein
MSRRSRTANVLAALTTILLATNARGQAAAASAVVVNVVGAGDSQAALEGSLRELLARLHLEMNPADARPESVLARVQIDLTSPAQAIVLVTDGHTGEVRAHRVIPRDASAAITREEIAHAVQSAVESARYIEERAAAAPAPAPAPPPPPPVVIPAVIPREAAPQAVHSPSWFALDITTLAGAGPFASGAGPAVRVGGGALASSRGFLRPSLAVTAFYTVPFQAEASPVGSYANLASIRAVPSIEVLHSSWFALDVGAGGGIDVLSVQPRTATLPSGYLNAPTSRVDPIVSGVVTARVALAAGVVFVVAADADVDLISRHYVVDQGASQSDVFAPWSVRPTIFAGLAFTAIGEGLFAKRAIAQESR